MGDAFDVAIPEKILALLKPGDLIAIQNFNWWVSWLIMYLTHSSISHVTYYLGNRTIAHMTLDGLVKERVESLFKPDARILPFIWFLPDDKRTQIQPYLDSMKDVFYYDKLLLLRKGLNIIFGRDWGLFRWAFLADVAITLFLLDVLVYSFTGLVFVSLLFPLYVLILIINRLLWSKRLTRVLYPEQFINGLFSEGHGMPLLNLHLSRLDSQPEKVKNDTGRI